MAATETQGSILNTMPNSPFANQALRLLDFSNKLDITLLDSVVTCFYGTVGQEVSPLAKQIVHEEVLLMNPLANCVRTYSAAVQRAPRGMDYC